MPDIQQLTSDLRSVPDQALQQQLQQPSGLVPSYLVLAEAQRRQLMRQAAQQQQAQGDSSTVLQDVVKNMMANQPPPGIAPAGMAPKGQSPTPGQQPTPTPPQPGAQQMKPPGMAQGGALHFDDGGGVDDDSDLIDNPDNGVIDWSQFNPARAALSGAQQAHMNRRAPSAGDIDGWINQYSQKYGVDPDMARSIMHQESGGRYNVMGKPTRYGQAVGLFQVLPSTAREMGVDPYQPEQNVEGGIKFYRRMLDRYGGNSRLALAAYNAGPAHVDHYGAVPPFRETRNYVRSITADYDRRRLESQVAAQREAGQMHPAMRGPNYQPAPYEPGADIQPQPQSLATSASLAPSAPVDLDALLMSGMPDMQRPPAPAAPAAQQGAADRQAPDQSPGQIIPSAASNDPWSPENIQRTRNLWDTLTGDSAESRQQLRQQRAATIQQLQQLQQEQMDRYRNPDAGSFLSNLAAGMAASKSLSLAGAFAQGVGTASQARDAQQQQALSNAESLEQRIDALQNVGETERERMGAQMVNLMTRPNQGQQQDMEEFQKFLTYPGAVYGQKSAAHPGFAFKEDPRAPGFGVWIPMDQSLQPVKGNQEEQIFRGQVRNVATMIGKSPNTSYESLPVNMTLKQPLTLPQDIPMPDGTTMKAGTVLQPGTTIYPQLMAESLRDRSKSQQAQQTAIAKAVAGPEGRRAQIQAGNFMQDGYTDEQRQAYIDSGKVPQKIDDLAAGVARGEINIKEAMSRGQLTDRNFLIKKILEINPSYNEATQEAEYAGQKGTEAKFDSGPQGQRIQNVNTLVQHLDALRQAADALDNGDITLLNNLANKWGGQTGNVPLNVYRSILHAVGPETTNAYIASGGTYQDRHDVEKDFSENQGADALRGAISARAHLLGGVITPLNNEYVSGTYGRGTRHLHFWTPETIGTLERLAPGAVPSMTRERIQHWADKHVGGDFAAAQKRFADAGIFLRDQ